jgi:hypothetical protein
MVIGQIIECLCKVCFLAEHKPYPYNKWLVRGARDTKLGADLFPLIERVAKGTREFFDLQENETEFESVEVLLSANNVVKKGLVDLGWDPSWVNDMVRLSMAEAQKPQP